MVSKNDRTHWLRPWVVTIIVSIFLAPTIHLPGAIPSVRVDELILVPFVFYCMIQIVYGHDVVFAWGIRQYLFIFLFGILFISILSGLFLGNNASLRDLNQVVRFSKYILIYTIYVSYVYVGNNRNHKRGVIFDTIVVVSVISSFIVVQQYFDFFSLNSVYLKVISPSHYDAVIGQPIPRPLGMIGNPNEVAFTFVVGALVSSYRLIKGGGWMFMGATIVNLVSIGLTLSRTSLVALVIGAGYIYVVQLLVNRRKIGERIKYLSLPLILIVAVIAYVLVNPALYEAIGWRFATLSEFQSTSSWQARQFRWQKNIRLFLESPFFGLGPLRNSEITPAAADNEWLLLLRTYGVVGTLVLTIGIVWPHLQAKRRLLRVLISALFISTAVYMLPAAVFHSLVLMPLLLVVIATEDPTVRRVNLI